MQKEGINGGLKMLDFELAVLDFIQANFKTAFGDFIMPVISALGNGGIIWICISLIFCLLPKYRKYGITMFIALILDALICNIILKPLVARTRPFAVNTSINLLISAPKDYSFPSGHTAASFSAAFSLFFGKNELWKPAVILAALIAFSRLYLYVHYPTDVFTGIVIGVIIGFLSNIIYRKAETLTCKI